MGCDSNWGILDRQLEVWKWKFETTSPLKMLCCKMLQYDLAKGHDLADAVEDQGEKVGPEG